MPHPITIVMITIKLLVSASNPNSLGARNTIVSGAIKKVSPLHRNELVE